MLSLQLTKKRTVKYKMKVLFIMHMPPPVHGAAMMGKYIHDSRVVNETFDCHYINLATAKDLADIGKIRLQKFTQFYQLLSKVRKEVKRIRPELVYVTPNAKGGAFYKDFIVIQMLKRMGCKVVVHYHNKGVLLKQDKVIDNLLYRTFFKKLKVILLAEALYADVQKYVPRKDVFICPNGIPEALTAEPSAIKHNAIPKLLFLSNLLIDKGVFTILDACKILKNKGYQFTCDFVGGETADINAERFNLEVTKRGLNEQICYKGKKYGVEKEEILKNADLFIFPTYYSNECFPLVLLEAMQQGLPCISTNEGGIADIIIPNETGYIIPKKSAQELADKIEILLKDNSLRIAMGNKGLERYKHLFTLNAFEQRIVSILKDILITKNNSKFPILG